VKLRSTQQHDTEMALVNETTFIHTFTFMYSRDAILKRFDKHEKKLAALVDISNASVEQPLNDTLPISK
jgi:hypothetical protein